MRLEKYINQLLFQHDCVIVPKFGAFISHPVSTKINSEDHTISPPYKELTFNSSLTTNDGILLHTYATEENIDLALAKEYLSNDVDQWKVRLSKGESIVLDNIGTLHLTAEEVLQFEPHTTENFLIDSFGLKTIKPQLIIKQNIETALDEPKRNWSSLLAAASIIPILIGGYFYFNTPQPIQKYVDHQWSGVILPVIKDAVPTLVEPKQELKEINHQTIHNLPSTIQNPVAFLAKDSVGKIITQDNNDSLTNPILSKYEITVVEEKQLNEDETEVKAIIKNTKVENPKTDKKESNTKELTTAKAEDNSLKIETNPKKFQIIAASLRQPDDAKRMLESLKKDGYKNANIVYVKGRYYYVTYDSFTTKDDAAKYLNSLHEKHPDAWVREHR